MSVRSTFTWHMGEDLLLTFTATTVTPIAGWTISLSIYDFPGGTLLLGPIPATLVDVVNGVFTVALSSANTSAVGRMNRFLQVRRTDTGDNTVLAEGAVIVNP